MKEDKLTFPDSWQKVMDEWLEYKKSIRKPYKNSLSIMKCYANLVKMSGNNVVIAQDIVDQSIGNGWIGLFPIRQQNMTRSEATEVDAVLDAMLELENISDDMRKKAYKAKYEYPARKLLKIAGSVDFAKKALGLYPKLSKCPKEWNLWNLVNDFDFVLDYIEKQKRKESKANFDIGAMVEEVKYGK